MEVLEKDSTTCTIRIPLPILGRLQAFLLSEDNKEFSHVFDVPTSPHDLLEEYERHYGKAVS